MGRRKQFGPALPPAMAKARRAAARKSAPKSKKAVVALVKSVIAKEQETKFRSEIIENNTPYNSQIGTGDIIRLLPKLVQDQGSGATYERIGMKISPRKLQIQADVCLTDVSRSSALVVVYWVLQSKDIKDIGNLTLLNLGNSLLRTGDNMERQGFNGYVADSMIPVCPSRYTVLKKGSFLLGKNTGVVQDSTTGSNQPMYGNHIKKRLSFNLKVPKSLTYDEDTNTPRTIYYPKGYAPFMVFGYYHQNQTAPDVANQDISVTLRSSLYFDDA